MPSLGVMAPMTPDTPYSWVVLVAVTSQNILQSMQYGGLGVILVHIYHHFGTNKTAIGWVGACASTSGQFFAFPLSFLIKWFGPRIMTFVGSFLIFGGYFLFGIFPTLPMAYVGFGVIASIGYSLIFMTGIVATQQYFVKKRSLASGIFMAGIGMGVFLLPPIVEFLIEHYALQGALLILSAISLHGCVCGAFYRPIQKDYYGIDQQEIHSGDDVVRTDNCCKKLAQVTKESNIPFAVYIFGLTLVQAGNMVVNNYIAMRADSYGISMDKAAILVSLIGITGCPARVAGGAIGTLPCVRRTVMYGLAAIIGGSLTLVSTQFNTFMPLAFYTACYGICVGMFSSLQPTLISDLLGMKHVEVGSGFFVLAHGVGYLILHPTTGWLMDYTGSTSVPSLVFGTAQILGGLMIAMIPLIQRLITDTEEENTYYLTDSKQVMKIDTN